MFDRYYILLYLVILFINHSWTFSFQTRISSPFYRWYSTNSLYCIHRKIELISITNHNSNSSNPRINNLNSSNSTNNPTLPPRKYLIPYHQHPYSLITIQKKNKNKLMQVSLPSTLVVFASVVSKVQAISSPSSFSSSKVIYNGAIGYEAAASAFSPGQALKTIPLLPQSALLNSLPLKNELIGQLQAYFESFVQLISPLPTQQLQIMNNNSILWTNLRINAQRAAGIFIYNKKDLMPKLNALDVSTDVYIKTYEIAEKTLDRLQIDALKLVNVSGKSQVRECLRGMQRCLNGLCDIAYLLTNPLSNNVIKDKGIIFNTTNGDIFYSSHPVLSTFDQLSINNFTILQKYYQTLPRLLGRATVILTFQRPGSTNILQSFRSSSRLTSDEYDKFSINREQKVNVKLLVDGINHPYTAGNFIDLCLKDYYSNIPVKQDFFEDFDGFLLRGSNSNSNSNNGNKSTISSTATTTTSSTMKTRRTILGDYKDGYIDPITNFQRRIPLEILRRDNSGSRYTTIGAARNSVIFEPSPPVLSFATYGAIGLYHAKGDNNGGSSSFFWLPADSSQTLQERNSKALFSTLNNQFTLFAYAIEGNDVLENLKPGDLLVSATVEDGVWQLKEPNFLEELLQE